MIRGRKPIPAELRLVTATRDKKLGSLTRERLTKNRPKAEPSIPDPPVELSELARQEWDRLALPLYNLGVMTQYDRAVFALYCQAWGRWRKAEAIVAKEGEVIETKLGNIIQHPALGISNRAARECIRYAAELGLTPSARSRIDTKGLNARAAEQAEADEYQKYFG